MQGLTPRHNDYVLDSLLVRDSLNKTVEFFLGLREKSVPSLTLTHKATIPYNPPC